MFGSMSVSYDAENRQIAAGGTSYAYDGAGQRVKKVAPSGTTVYVYDAFGQLAAEYASGPATGSACGSTCYLSYDLLGTVRLVTDGQHNVVARHDYAPFGQEIPAGVGGRTNFWAASDSVNQKFTGYERDGETSLDFAQARYMSSGLGRFMSPDPANAGADFTNPQSWNAYAYVLGNPLGNVDPSGMSDNPCSSNFSCLAQIPGCLDDVTACQQKVFWPDTALGWDPFRLMEIPSDHYWSDGWHAVYGGDALLYSAGLSASTGSTATGVPAVTPAKTGTCSNLPAGSSPAFCQALQQGLQNALRSLKRRSCSNFYGGQGPQTLDATQYRFLDLQKSTTGAATISPNSVFVNSKGPYMTYTPSPGQTGPFERSWTQGQFRGFILLHELGHQLSPVTGFQPDAGRPLNQLNQQQSREVLSACF
jgi:RHS repeat-associated protein